MISRGYGETKKPPDPEQIGGINRRQEWVIQER